LECLKQHHKGTYINLLTSGRLNTYLVNIDKQEQEHFEKAHRKHEAVTRYNGTAKGRKHLRVDRKNE